MLRADLPRIAAVEGQIYPFPWSLGNFADSLIAGYDCWVFESEAGELACYAVAMWIPDEVHLLNFSVPAAMQRRGIGRTVLEWLCRDSCSRGARGMLLEVRPSNAPAVRLYETSRFERIGVRRRYYPAAEGMREDAWVLFRTFGHDERARGDEERQHGDEGWQRGDEERQRGDEERERGE